MPETFGYLDFSRALVIVGGVLGTWTILSVLLGQVLGDRRWVLVARRCMVGTGLVTVGAAIGLTAGFVNGAYERSYIFNYSEKGLPLQYKIAGLWGGLDGSILFWSALIGLVGMVVARGFRRDHAHPDGRRLEPWVYVVFGVVQLFFLYIVAFVANPFEHISETMQPGQFAAMFPDGHVPDGSGLNPLLVNYWMMIHPPTLYLGWVIYTVPFAFAIASLVTGEQGSYWITKIRRWAMVGWLFNTTGIVLGGLWAYVVLGWGGYWAWDPVENASFLPWFTSTALLHSIMVQERRNMMRAWTALLATCTFVLSIFGTYLTRSGIVSSVHAFASGEVGHYFLAFLLLIIAVSLFLIAVRHPAMRSPHRIESFWSREAVLVVNNMVLIAIAASVIILTLWPKISNDLFGRAITVGPPVYNQVTIPFFILLLALTAVGPLLGWIRTSPSVLKRNLLLPALVSVPVAAVVQYGAEVVRAGETGDLDWGQRLYPTYLVIYSSTLIIFSLGYELYRTVSNRAQRTGAGFVDSLSTVLIANNRRYGGYLVHVGMGVIAIGIVCSSMYRVEREFEMREGDRRQIGSYEITFVQAHSEPDRPVYRLDTLELSVQPADGNAFTLHPEKRHYRKKDQPVTEVEIHRGLFEDLYVYFQSLGSDGTYMLTFYRNPMMNGVWLGWILMVLGGVYAALPMRRKRVGLAD